MYVILMETMASVPFKGRGGSMNVAPSICSFYPVCNFQSMKSLVELNSLLSKFFCYITWFVISPDQTRLWTTCKRGLYVKSFCFFETIAYRFKNYKLNHTHRKKLCYSSMSTDRSRFLYESRLRIVSIRSRARLRGVGHSEQDTRLYEVGHTE